MADNIAVTPSRESTRVDTRTEDISDVHYPCFKLYVGAANVSDGPISSANPLPVGSIGDGDTIDREDADGTVGTSKGILSYGVDYRNEARHLKMNPDGDVYAQMVNDLADAILNELKKLNLHMSLITDTLIANADLE